MMKLELLFDGPALKDHEMELKGLGASLIALDSLYDRANTLLNGDKSKIQVKASGSFKTGCFIVEIKILYEQLKTLIGDDLTTAVGILTLLGSLVRLLRWLKGQKITKIVESRSGLFRVYKSDKYIEVEKQVIALHHDYRVRKYMEQLIEPVKSAGIDRISLKRDSEEDFIEIEKKEVDYFNYVPLNLKSIAEPTVYKMSVSIVDLSFNEDKTRWRFDDGQSVFISQVEDEGFLGRVQNGEERFAINDILVVEARKEQYFDSNKDKLESKIFIQKVLKHLERPKTLL